MRNLGTDEPFILEDMTGLIGMRAVSAHWRKPLRIDEINQMAPTAEVKARPGRP